MTETTECPGPFQWSAFGANYMDTSCHEGYCLDLDTLTTHGDIPCPFCNPEMFFEWGWGGNYVEPTCKVCLTRLPVSSVRFVDGRTLTWTVACATCDTVQPGLLIDYVPDTESEPS